MQIKEQNINKILTWLLVISAIVRGFLAAWMEFGNDEVYYWAYALYPDWSHFDHPPIVGWVIQFFSLNLLFDSEFFIRLASVVLMTANTCIIYRIGKDTKDARTGLYAALLYTASIYAFVITGIFIMPDTPLMLFWLLAFWMAVKCFHGSPRSARNDFDTAPCVIARSEAIQIEKPKEQMYLILFGLFAGLAMLSKYSGIFLWVGLMLYILIFNRMQLKNPYLYLSLLISFICCIPILYWNFQNDFISFRFHGERVGLFGKPNFGMFGTELAGEFLYNNPVNFILAIIAIVAAFKKKIRVKKPVVRLMLCIALPLIVVFLFFSLTHPTLPHWNSPAYVLAILLSASYLREKHFHSEKLPKSIIAALGVLLLTLVVGVAEIKTGFIPLDKHTEPEQLGRDDFTLDMYGWRQLGEKFAVFREQQIAEGVMSEEDGIVANQWFPLANLDYYVARPLGMRVMGLGWPEQLHKYLWINDERGGFHLGENYWFLTDSRYLKDPQTTYQWYFKEIELVGVIEIERCGKHAKNFFVYICKSLMDQPPTLQDFMTASDETASTNHP
ncbi:MAG: glycosyltransferase family 39 protein [Bacteroidales bacterium]|nr:glycosyltransferase family 39 protein [Bacteroidales bacterium]